MRSLLSIRHSFKSCRLNDTVSFGLQPKHQRESDFLSTEEERLRYCKVLIAFHLSRSEWGRGYVTEATLTLIDWAIGQPQVVRIWTVVDVDNVASIRVLEKVGMIREGLLKRWSIHPNVSPEPRDFYVCSFVKPS